MSTYHINTSFVFGDRSLFQDSVPPFCKQEFRMAHPAAFAAICSWTSCCCDISLVANRDWIGDGIAVV